MDTQQSSLDTRDTHLSDRLIGQHAVLHLLNGKTLWLRIVDLDYYYLLVETPRKKAQFLLNRMRVIEIEPLTQQEAEARLNHNGTAQAHEVMQE